MNTDLPGHLCKKTAPPLEKPSGNFTMIATATSLL